MKKGQQTRERILDHGLALASTAGLDGLSIAGMAKTVGLSKSGLFAHFDSKEDLQVQVLDRAIRRFIEVVVAPALRHPRGEPRVRALFDRWLEWAKMAWLPGGCVFIQFASELDDRPGALRERLVGAQRDWMSTLATAARIAVDEGHFDSGLDAEQFAYELYSIILAHHHHHRLLRDPESEARAHKAFEGLIEKSRPGTHRLEKNHRAT